jgi:polysaccharide biosynthesis/export protein
MKRTAVLSALFILVITAAGAQSAYTDQTSDSLTATLQNPVIQAGDPALVTQRIMSSTRYKVTPGDLYRLAITMDTVTTYSLTLQENYDIEIPYLGTINVKGKLFSDLRKIIHDDLKKALPMAQYINLTLESAARFDVTVFGGVLVPGIVTVMPLSRVSDAISLAGKAKPGSSSRQISLIRGGKTISVDLMRYSRGAESDDNPYLEPGDKIFVPQAVVTVSISGQVKYPGIYEIIPGESLSTLLAYAGGVTPGARTDGIELSHFAMEGTPEAAGSDAQNQPRSLQGSANGPQVRIINLGTEGGTPLANGDRIRVPSLVENRAMVLVTGGLFGSLVSTEKAVKIPTAPITVNLPYSPNLTLLSVLETLGGPTPYARAKESLVIRKATGERIGVDVDALWSTRDATKDILLQPGDIVEVPMVVDVFVAGEVLIPGKVPYDPASVVSDYLRAAGGINPDTSNANCIYFAEKNGTQTKTNLMASVEPGTVIIVQRNGFTSMLKTFDQISSVTAFVTVIIAFLTRIDVFYNLIVSILK